MRRKGSVNRTSAETKTIINKMLSDCLDTIESDLQRIKPLERINVVLGLLPYLLPKLRSSENRLDFNKLDTEEIKHAVNQLLEDDK
jgi:hypothetical protein